MSVRDATVVKELVALLSAKGEAPRSAVGCEELVQHLVEAHPQFERHADAFAWQLIVRAALTPDSPGSSTRPLAAAKHLLALGAYPEDIERDTQETAEQIRLAKPKSSDMDPVRWVTVRRKIAARAGNYGADPSNLHANHPGGRLKRVAEALWAEMKTSLASDDLTTQIAQEVKREESLSSSENDSARQTAIRRLRRIQRKRFSTRVTMVAPKLGKALFVALTVLSLGSFGITIFRTSLGVESTSEIDPLVALESGEGWRVGIGPSQMIREQLTEGDLALNVSREAWVFGPATTSGSFVSLSGDFTNEGGLEVTEPGRYQIEVRVRLEHEGYWGNDDGLTEGASVLIGTLPLERGFPPYAVFARIEADGVSPVWDGAGFALHPDCDCTFSIDPTSARLYSNAIPDGVRLEVRDDTISSLIGFEGTDGVLRSSPQNDVRIVATLVVSERGWGN